MASLNINTTQVDTPVKTVSQAEIDAQVFKMTQEVKNMLRREITLPLIDPKDTVQEMSVNCYTLLIPRGVRVSIPECFVEVLEQIDEANLKRMRADAAARRKTAQFLGVL